MEFEISDPVKVIKAEFECEQQFLGRDGTIIDIDFAPLPQDDDMFIVLFPDGEQWAFFANQITRIEKE